MGPINVRSKGLTNSEILNIILNTNSEILNIIFDLE